MKPVATKFPSQLPSYGIAIAVNQNLISAILLQATFSPTSAEVHRDYALHEKWVYFVKGHVSAVS